MTSRKPQLTSDEQMMVISVPVNFQQSNGRKQIIVPAGAAEWRSNAPRIDNSLVNAIARAHRWRQMIETHRYASAAELSRKEGVNESYVCRLLRLTLLAPNIVEAILDGEQPQTLDLKTLMRPLSNDWAEQRRYLGFSLGDPHQ